LGGRGSITLKLSPDGTVAPAAIDPVLRHTAVGECVDTEFRAVHIPAFSGGAMEASGTFDVEQLPADYWSAFAKR
jgi:hypothetical protein